MFTFKNGKLVANNKQRPVRDPPAIKESDIPDFKNEVKNKLESIIILTTRREINEGSLDKLLDNISKVTSKTDIDLNIFTNNSNHNPISLDKVNEIFNCVNIVNINIDPDSDIYLKEAGPDVKLPPHGAVSGPNILFLKAMNECKKYNTVLVLETDCILFPEWLEKSKNYVNTEYFLMSGSTYDGYGKIPHHDISMYMHLNGVAFYKTGSLVFQFIMLVLDKYIVYLVLSGDRVCAYDICITFMIFSYMSKSPDPELIKFWRFAFRYIFKTSLIVNMSPKSDKRISEDEILSMHKNCVILHKKPTSSAPK
jgi:hypothetical protein